MKGFYFLICCTFLTVNRIDSGTTREPRNIFKTPTIINAIVPPNHKDYVAMARFVVHQADWASVATLSTIQKIKNYPFTNIASMSDGTVDHSIGIPYFYLTPLDFASKDLTEDSRCTISVTLEETSYCRQQNYDPDDPRCARVMLSGRMVTLKNGTEEYDFAKEALFTRHHSMANLPADHKFYVTKLQLEQIVMLDWFGGPAYISIDEYLAYSSKNIYKSAPFTAFVKEDLN
ncbi:cellular Repressor of E1A-stimulated Genes [Arctopsyche grandis]|uniref:cellular Repressor of E1A-stimulated Genes n=1 Tax=Arctopsyche grandis TaxID=121162 RepID=UPI00406D637A